MLMTAKETKTMLFEGPFHAFYWQKVMKESKYCRHETFEIYPAHFIPDSVSYASRYPLGVVGIITSWTSPLHSILWHAIPALASGNCVVIKPSCLAPIEVHLLAKTFSDAGNAVKSDRIQLILHDLQRNNSLSSILSFMKDHKSYGRSWLIMAWSQNDTEVLQCMRVNWREI